MLFFRSSRVTKESVLSCQPLVNFQPLSTLFRSGEGEPVRDDSFGVSRTLEQQSNGEFIQNQLDLLFLIQPDDLLLNPETD